MKNENNNTAQRAVTAAIAATSATPFKTAFKITMGIAAANLLIGVSVFAVFVAGVYLLAKLAGN